MEPGRLAVQYPGGISARFRWGGPGQADVVFGVSESAGELNDYTELSGSGASACRAELRVESPSGSWTARLASQVFDEPQGTLVDTANLLLIKYGFAVYAFHARSGELAWSHLSGTPVLSVLASTRLDHVLMQTELETLALRNDGDVAWRAAHSDVITHAQLVAGRLDLTTYNGLHVYLDATTGQAA